MSCRVLSCLVLSCLISSCLVLSRLVLSCLVLPCLVLSCLLPARGKEGASCIPSNAFHFVVVSLPRIRHDKAWQDKAEGQRVWSVSVSVSCVCVCVLSSCLSRPAHFLVWLFFVLVNLKCCCNVKPVFVSIVQTGGKNKTRRRSQRRSETRLSKAKAKTEATTTTTTWARQGQGQ